MGTSRPLLLLKMPEQIYTGVQNILKWSHQIFFFIWLLVLSAKIQIHYLKRIFLATVTTKFYYLPFAIGYSVAKVKFCQVYFNYLNFTKASSTSQLHTTAWNSKVRFYKRLFSLFNTSTQWLKITQKCLIFVKK